MVNETQSIYWTSRGVCVAFLLGALCMWIISECQKIESQRESQAIQESESGK